MWQASELSRLAWDRFGEEADKRTGLRLLKQLQAGYPASSLISGVDQALASFDTAKAMATTGSGSASMRPTSSSPRPVTTTARAETSEAVPNGVVTVRAINRTTMPDGIRVSIEMEREVIFRQERLDNPKRLFFDLRGAYLSPGLRAKNLSFNDDIVKEIRLGRQPQNTTRVVMDLEGVDTYSVFTLYNPYRVVIDFRRKTTINASAAATPAPPAAAQMALAAPPALPPARPKVLATPLPPPVPVSEAVALAPLTPPPPPPPLPLNAPRVVAGVSLNKMRTESKPSPPKPLPPAPKAPVVATSSPLAPLPSRSVVPPSPPAPTVPLANSNGQFSLARQLGLGINRIVIDPGHGGHDPGVRGNGINESELVLDVSQRLQKLLEKQPGMEVVMTRDTDVFIPLEQRTAIANREGADLFLSIHANASRNIKAGGIETYFLNFAANPEAEAVAARENSASGQTMHRLPDIVRAITLNNKIDESRDFADTVQKSMVHSLSSKYGELQDRGVKQAPFVVLIGAGMPSVLAEISFVTHKQEGALLKTPAYRQQIAEALFDAILKYQKSLKARATIASREE